MFSSLVGHPLYLGSSINSVINLLDLSSVDHALLAKKRTLFFRERGLHKLAATSDIPSNNGDGYFEGEAAMRCSTANKLIIFSIT